MELSGLVRSAASRYLNQSVWLPAIVIVLCMSRMMKFVDST